MNSGISGINGNSGLGRVGRSIVILGLALRLAVFAVLGPLNNDNHYEVIRHIALHHEIPRYPLYNQAYHPPLYHVLAAGLYLINPHPKIIQAFSLLCSWATLLTLGWLVGHLPWLQPRFKPWMIGLAALHPQFILYNLFVSNDTLAILLGALIFAQVWRVIERPSLGRQLTLAGLLGLGLLTKATFLAFLPPLVIFILLMNWRETGAVRTRLARVGAFLLLALALGGYKYVDNMVIFGGRPFVNNLDGHGWADRQRPTWRGASSLVDFNLGKLTRHPVISAETAHSWPLILYGTLWYSFIPESTFRSNLTPYNRLGSLIYLAALVPTLLLGIGLVRIVTRTAGRGKRLNGCDDQRLFEGTAALILLCNLALIVAVGWKYDVWSVFQSRLLFSSYAAFLLLLHEGLAWAEGYRLLAGLSRLMLTLLFGLFLAYLGVEIKLSARYPADPYRAFHNPITIDMNQP